MKTPEHWIDETPGVIQDEEHRNDLLELYAKIQKDAAAELSALQKENAELKAANDYNDTDLPLDELLGGIDDAVMDFKPDCDSDSAGTLLERVQAAAELGKEAATLRTQNRELREALQHQPDVGHEVFHAGGNNCPQCLKDKALALKPEK